MLRLTGSIVTLIALQLGGCAAHTGARPPLDPAPSVSAQTPLAVDPRNLYTYRAVVRRVVDGDTVDVDVDLGMHVWLHDERLRLARINAPELKGAEREQGRAAREWLRERLEGKSVLIRTAPNRGNGYDEQDKFGRYLAEIILDGVNINDELLRLGLAKPYTKD